LLPILLGLLLFSAFPSIAQRLSPAMQALAAEDYAGYLTAAPAEVAAAMTRPEAVFATILPAAIALEKTKRWDDTSGKQIAGIVAKSPDAARYLQACKLLVQGEAKGLPMLFNGTPPSPYDLSGGARLAREHGFTLAADCLTAVSHDMPGLRVKAWLSVPADQRAQVAGVMVKIVAPVNLRMLADMALDFYIHPPQDLGPIPPAELLAFARKYGNVLQVISFKTAERLLQAGKQGEGLAIAREVAAEDPADPERQRYAADLFATRAQHADAAKLYWDAIANAPAPFRRQARLNYLAHQQWLREHPLPGFATPTELQASADPLMAGDALYTAGQLPQAAAHYLTAANNPDASIPQCLEAWSGLLDTDPAGALPLGTRLLVALSHTPAAARASWLRWAGWEMARAVQNEQLLPPGYLPTHGQRYTVTPLHTAPHWQADVAAWYCQLVEIDPGAVLHFDDEKEATLRLPIAVACALNHRHKEAAEILLRPVACTVPPPTGGWRIDGIPTPDADQPRIEQSPAESELDFGVEALFTVLRRYPPAAHDIAPVAACLAQATAAELRDAKHTGRQVTHRVQLLQLCLRMHAAGQNPPAETDTAPRPQRHADMAAFAVLDTAIRDALAQDAVGTQAALLWQSDFLSALLTMRDPKLVDGYFNLLTLSFDRYIAVTKNADTIAVIAAGLATAMEDNQNPPRPDLKPYAQRLREKYPQQEAVIFGALFQ